MNQPVPKELKPAYRTWCSLLVQEWEKCSTWGRLLSKAEAQGLPLSELPTTIDGFVHFKTPLRVVVAERFPTLSKKLFDAEDATDRGMVALWLMQHPQTPTATPKTHQTPFSEVAREVQHNHHVMQASDMTQDALRKASRAGGHVAVRGRQGRSRFPGR